MATKKTTKKTAKKRSASKAEAKPKTPAKQKKLSGLDAAVKVLAEATEPLNCKEIVERMLAKGLWHTSGKTPAATIYAAIIRQIAAKGDGARFRMVWRKTVKYPLLRLVAQMCVKPRKSNVSGLPSPRFRRLWAAHGPNSISRVLSGCNSNPNLANRCRKAARNRSASWRCWNPTMKSSA